MVAATARRKTAAAALVSITLPALAKGEVYAGILLDKGKPTHHLILLPGAAKEVTWEQAKEFAKKAGGELPTRREQSLLFANCKAEFEERWYWSGEQHVEHADYAWGQDFGNGFQHYGNVTYSYRARAVRREPIQ